MKKLLSLLFLFCTVWTACQDDDMQEVAFETEQIMVDAEAQSVTVTVQANCPWYLSSDSERAYATSTYGEGTTIIDIVVFKNSSYETGQYTFTLTSEDGSDKATLVVVQDARIKMEISTDGDVPPTGGNYSIYLNTNDAVRCTDIPEWVTHVSSRAVEKQTFILECKPNRTGSPRHATIIFTGKKDDYPVNIKQDSYTPESADFKIPNMLTEGLITYKYPVTILPVYADWSKLYPELTDGGRVWIEKENVYMEFPAYGEYTLSVYAAEKLVHKQTISVKPVDAVLNIEDGARVCVGENVVLSDDNCSLRFSDNSLVSKQGDGSYTFVREGKLTIKATNDWSSDMRSATVHIEKVVLDVESTRTTVSDGKNFVSVLFTARGADIGDYRFYLTENGFGNDPIELKTGSSDGQGVKTLYYRTPSESFANSTDDPVAAFFAKYTLHFEADINGKLVHLKKNFK